MVQGSGWATVFSEIAHQLNEADGPDENLRAIVTLATKLTGCPWAAIVADTELLPVIAAVNDARMARRIARVQASGGGGPTWEAVRTGSQVYVPELFTEGRWPEHVLELLDHTPVRSILAMGLQLDDEQPLGALTLYGNRPHAFPPETQDLASVVAAHAALALDRLLSGDRGHRLGPVL